MEYSNISSIKNYISTFYFTITNFVISGTNDKKSSKKMCSRRICLGHCRSSIKHTAWFKPHLRMSSLRATYGPQAHPSTPPRRGRLLLKLLSHLGLCVLQEHSCLTLQLILRVTAWSAAHTPLTWLLWLTQACVVRHHRGDFWSGTTSSSSGYMMGPRKGKPKSAAKQGALKAALLPDGFHIEISLIEMLFLAKPMEQTNKI